ncbi:MAG: DNA recombination protein RmuC [Bowdeniella nasicola]|nr:DNA recombination protein RmuC [Bowdeniella nasicola]
MDTTTVILVALALLIGLALGYLLAQRRHLAAAARHERELGLAQGKVAELQSLHQRAETDRAGHQQLALLVQPLAQRVEELGKRVHTADRERAAHFAALRQQLTEHRAAGEELTRSTTMLAGALRNASARGLWGEVELERLVEAAGMQRYIDFSPQAVLESGSRPDMVIHLPGSGAIAVDAKVPFDAYLRAAELAEDPSPAAAAERAELLDEHAKALRRHIDALAKRAYPDDLPDGPDITVLFVPAEPLLAGACEADPALLEYAIRQRVCLASPVSFLALLRTVAASWSREEVSQQANQLLEASREMLRRLTTFAKHLDNVGKSLGSSVTAYNQAVGSFDSRLTVQARSLAELGLGDVPEVRRVDHSARSVSYGAEPEETSQLGDD